MYTNNVFTMHTTIYQIYVHTKDGHLYPRGADLELLALRPGRRRGASAAEYVTVYYNICSYSILHYMLVIRLYHIISYYSIL